MYPLNSRVVKAGRRKLVLCVSNSYIYSPSFLLSSLRGFDQISHPTFDVCILWPFYFVWIFVVNIGHIDKINFMLVIKPWAKNKHWVIWTLSVDWSTVVIITSRPCLLALSWLLMMTLHKISDDLCQFLILNPFFYNSEWSLKLGW